MLCCCPEGGAFCAAAVDQRLDNVWTFIFPLLHLSATLRSVEIWEAFLSSLGVLILAELVTGPQGKAFCTKAYKGLPNV